MFDIYLYNSKQWINYLENNFNKCEYFFKFAMVWMSFNSYYEIKYKKIEGDKNKAIKFCEDNEKIYNNLMSDNEEFKKIVVDFKKTKYLDGSDDRKCVANETRNQKWYFNDDRNSCSDFMNVIYQIRNNFFHGSKNVSNPYNHNLIKWAYKYFSIFWKEFIKNHD